MTLLSDAAVARLRDAAMWPELPGDRYQALRLVARGGMGSVYAARDTLLDRDVAIKVSNTAGPAPSSARSLDARLADESKILARLEHPGIVPVHDAGVLADGRTFYVMKLVDGLTLEDSLPALPDVTARLAIFDRIVDTVAFAHAAGIVHRDLKPSNIMIGGFGEVLVLDWGVARVLPAGAPIADADLGLRVGTPGFMPPEQRDGVSLAGPTSDVYALGALLRWLLMSEPPQPRRLQAIIAKCLADAPTQRYASGAELRDDLVRYRAGVPVTAYRDTWFDHAGAWFVRHRVFIGLVAAYLLMRIGFLLYQ